jgi:hypothetical protein
MAAARWWARGGKPATAPPSVGAAKVASDLAAFGAPPELVARWSKAAAADQDEETSNFLVRPDCWRAVRLFCALETQWHWVGLGLVGASRTGLRYEAVEITARLSKMTLNPTLFADLRVMEGAALDELAMAAREDARRERGRVDKAGKKRGKRS